VRSTYTNEVVIKSWFNDAFLTSYTIGIIEWWDDCELWAKKDVEVILKVSQHLSGGTGENTRKLSPVSEPRFVLRNSQT
jgi:hypothetical protein